MNQRHPYRGILLCAAALGTAGILFAQPEICRQAAVQGLQLCGSTLLLGIFPFLIVSELIVRSGCAGLLARPLRPVARLLGCRAPAGAAILLLGFLGGFAPAAAAAASLCQSGEVESPDAAWLLAAAAGSSPSFVILAVGGQMLGSTALGVRLYLSQLMASCLTAALCRIAVKMRRRHRPSAKDNECRSSAAVPPLPAPDSFASGLSAAVSGATTTYLKLCGFVIYFRMLASAAAALLPQDAAALPAILLEVSTGCSFAAQRPVDAVYWCCAALSLQGLSVLLQIRTICPPQLSLAPLLLARPLHLALSHLILRLLLSGDDSTAVYSSLEVRVVTLPRLSPACALVLFALCLLVCDRLCRTLQAAENGL